MARLRGIKQRHPLGSVASRTGISPLTVVAVSSASTGVKISELPAASAAATTDQMEVNQGGVSRRLTLDQVSTLVSESTQAGDAFGVVNVMSYGATGDGVTDDLAAIHAAIAAVPTAGGKVIFPQGTYLISGAIVVTRGNITFEGVPDQTVVISSSSTTANHFTLNSQGVAYVFNVGMHNLTFSRVNVASAGWCIDMCNVGYSNFTKLRFYGNNTQWAGMRIRSSNQIQVSEMTSDNLQAQVLYVAGLSATVAGVDGTAIDIRVDDWNNGGGNVGGAAASGVFVLDDFCGGIWLKDIACHTHKGYAVYLKGTAPNVASNQLIYIDGLNVELTYAGSGALRVDNYRGVYCTNMQWVTGKDLNTVHLSSGASTVRYEGSTIALAYVSTEANCVYVDGTDVQFFGVAAVGYSGNTHGNGIYIDANADNVGFFGGEVTQLLTGLDIASASRTGKTINFVSLQFLSNGNVSNFDLTLAHDFQAVACTGFPTYMRAASATPINVGGSVISAPLRIVTDPLNVDGVDIRGGVSGQNAMSLTARGNDAVVSINFVTKSTGGVNFSNGNGGFMFGAYGGTLTSGQTGLYLGYHNGALTNNFVTLGAADSGGTGFKLLRVPN